MQFLKINVYSFKFLNSGPHALMMYDSSLLADHTRFTNHAEVIQHIIQCVIQCVVQCVIQCVVQYWY